MPPCPRRIFGIVSNPAIKIFPMSVMWTMKHEFPFKVRIGGHVVTVTGRHYSGLFETEGFGLIRGPLVPIETQEPAAAYAQLPVTSPDRAKVWKRQGCFRREPLTVVERNLRAERARSWLRKTLAGPMPASQVYALAKRAGIPARGLRRAKKRLGVKSCKVGGRHQGWGSVWFWSLAQNGGSRA
jgi:hypothetical protein